MSKGDKAVVAFACGCVILGAIGIALVFSRGAKR